jgi:hypothetical protein
MSVDERQRAEVGSSPGLTTRSPPINFTPPSSGAFSFAAKSVGFCWRSRRRLEWCAGLSRTSTARLSWCWPQPQRPSKMPRLGSSWRRTGAGRDGRPLVKRGGRAAAERRSLSSELDWENAENFAGRICQTKAVRFSAHMAFSHKIHPALGGSNCFGFARQHRRFPLDGNASPQPYNSKHTASPACRGGRTSWRTGGAWPAFDVGLATYPLPPDWR